MLKDHMRIDNFRSNDAVNMKPDKGTVPEKVRENFNFIRKGKVGDWQQHFTKKETLDEFNKWIEKNNQVSEDQPIEGLRYE